jgi:hypothetical protein
LRNCDKLGRSCPLKLGLSRILSIRCPLAGTIFAAAEKPQGKLAFNGIAKTKAVESIGLKGENDATRKEAP